MGQSVRLIPVAGTPNPPSPLQNARLDVGQHRRNIRLVLGLIRHTELTIRLAQGERDVKILETELLLNLAARRCAE